MSRCFPYPPPGYMRNGAIGEALIESIKREKKAAKKEKSERKKEKRERKQRRNEKLPDICHGEKLSNCETLKGEPDLNGPALQKSKEDETEQLEKSSVTAEYGQPICSQNASESSESTHSSSKRKRKTLPFQAPHYHGNVIRLRLPLQRHKDADASVSEVHICSTSGRTDSIPQPNGVAKTAARHDSASTIRETVGEEIPHTNQTSAGTNIIAHAASGSPTFTIENRRAESLYKVLIEDWVVPTLMQDQGDSGDQDWLFETKRHGGSGAKRCKASSSGSCHQNLTSWPRADYLPEADIFALPFTVPF